MKDILKLDKNDTHIREEQRVIWIDWFKCICILSVVIGHTGSMNSSMLHDFIYCFHVPLFFLVSGYLYKKKNSITDIRRLLLPIFFLSNVYLCRIGIGI